MYYAKCYVIIKSLYVTSFRNGALKGFSLIPITFVSSEIVLPVFFEMNEPGVNLGQNICLVLQIGNKVIQFPPVQPIFTGQEDVDPFTFGGKESVLS